ncbi:hypothetical protein LSUE1_G001122 [Lachnellula suecica]|uniref:FR47-like domain-containing protein n=1 Tax=Lachnellula suecica TaxID=602035 RepID=A0A8T9CGB8_9HELO|nr:hypothetical protein LSUE1_G001122 [Lachnellula suecica]
MEIIIDDNAEPTDLVLETLKQHLPYSLPTLRRIQFMKTTGGRKTSNSHVLSTFDKNSPGKDFLIAYLDFSKGPNSEMWLYSTIENPTTPSNEAVCEQQILKLLARVREIELSYEAPRETEGIVLIASLHLRVFQILQKHSLVRTKSPEHIKFIFKVNEMPLGRHLPDGLSWSVVRPDDIPLVLSRTSIPYDASAMKLLPSVAIETSSGVPIAWTFLGPDGSLKTLHCEEKYRGQGFAKAVALKLFRENAMTLVPDGYYHADVAVENLQSQGVCKSLKGTSEWSLYCMFLRSPY